MAETLSFILSFMNEDDNVSSKGPLWDNDAVSTQPSAAHAIWAQYM